MFLPRSKYDHHRRWMGPHIALVARAYRAYRRMIQNKKRNVGCSIHYVRIHPFEVPIDTLPLLGALRTVQYDWSHITTSIAIIIDTIAIIIDTTIVTIIDIASLLER